jgi:hypothetical protein
MLYCPFDDSANIGDFDQVRVLLEQMQRLGIPASLPVFQQHALCLMKISNFDAAIAVIHNMRSQAIERTPGFYRALLRAMVSHSGAPSSEFSLRVIALMREDRVEITSNSYTLLITAMHREGLPSNELIERIKATFQLMRDEGLAPEPFAAELYLESLLNSGDVDAGRDYFRALQLEVQPSDRSFCLLIHALCEKNDWARVHPLLEQLKLRRSTLPTNLVLAIWSTAIQNQRFDFAISLWVQLYSHGAEPDMLQELAVVADKMISLKQSKQLQVAGEYFVDSILHQSAGALEAQESMLLEAMCLRQQSSPLSEANRKVLILSAAILLFNKCQNAASLLNAWSQLVINAASLNESTAQTFSHLLKHLISSVFDFGIRRAPSLIIPFVQGCVKLSIPLVHSIILLLFLFIHVVASANSPAFVFSCTDCEPIIIACLVCFLGRASIQSIYSASEIHS